MDEADAYTDKMILNSTPLEIMLRVQRNLDEGHNSFYVGRCKSGAMHNFAKLDWDHIIDYQWPKTEVINNGLLSSHTLIRDFIVDVYESTSTYKTNPFDKTGLPNYMTDFFNDGGFVLIDISEKSIVMSLAFGYEKHSPVTT